MCFLFLFLGSDEVVSRLEKAKKEVIEKPNDPRVHLSAGKRNLKLLRGGLSHLLPLLAANFFIDCNYRDAFDHATRYMVRKRRGESYCLCSLLGSD
jgi:hypothetical protein